MRKLAFEIGESVSLIDKSGRVISRDHIILYFDSFENCPELDQAMITNHDKFVPFKNLRKEVNE